MPTDPPPPLIPALENAEGRIDRWVAILWTWLEPQLRELDSREEKLRSIRARGLKTPLWRRADGELDNPDPEAMLARLRAADDLLGGAAECLVALERWIVTETRAPSARGGPVAGIDGTLHFVRRLQPWLVRAFWANDPRSEMEHPAAAYAPSIQVLAPRLIVAPASTGGVTIEEAEPVDVAGARSVARARARLQAIAARHHSGEHPTLVIHLATLGPNPEEGLELHPGRSVFHYADPPAGGATERQIEHALELAVTTAAISEAAILILPELAVPVRCLPRLQERLESADPAPALTVAGLRHFELPRPEPTSKPATDAVRYSRWVNEAVVLGDDGSELFRHRKLTAYTLPASGGALQEDTCLGRRLPILHTAIGNIAVATCLDAFADTEERLRKSHASILLVPSLSGSVSPHRTALTDVVRWIWGAAFVCNRHPQASGEEAWLGDRVCSFWSVAMLNAWIPARRIDGSDVPTLVFDLGRDAAGNQSSSSTIEQNPDAADNP